MVEAMMTNAHLLKQTFLHVPLHQVLIRLNLPNSQLQNILGYQIQQERGFSIKQKRGIFCAVQQIKMVNFYDHM